MATVGLPNQIGLVGVLTIKHSMQYLTKNSVCRNKVLYKNLYACLIVQQCDTVEHYVSVLATAWTNTQA